MHALLDAGLGGRARCGGRVAGSGRAASPGRSTPSCSCAASYGDERVLLDPMAIDPTGRTTLDAWLPDLEGRLLAYQVSAGGDEHSVLHVIDVATGERRSSRRSTGAATRRWRGCPAGPSSSTSGWSHADEVPAGRAGVPPPRVAPPRRHPDERGPADRRARPLRRPHVLLRARLPRRPLAGGHRQRRHGPPRQRLDRRPARRRRRCTRCSPRPTTSSARRGSSATACSTCAPPTARRGGGWPSPTRAPRGASTGASWSPRTPTPCSTASAAWSRPTGRRCSCWPAAATPSPSWPCTTPPTAPRAAPCRCPDRGR